MKNLVWLSTEILSFSFLQDKNRSIDEHAIKGEYSGVPGY